MKENKINAYNYDCYCFCGGIIKMSKPGGKINTSKKSKPNYKGHQSSVRKGGMR